VEADVLFSGKFYEKNHKQFVKLDATPKVSIKLGNSEMHFDNLFNGNEELGKIANSESFLEPFPFSLVVREKIVSCVLGTLPFRLHFLQDIREKSE
jgi:Haemolymph juvenile hormone binding protein (JHBP).